MNIFAELETGIVAPQAEDTRAVAARLAAALPADRVLALSGELGAGKTTFVQGLATAWRIRERVTSPSFTVCTLHRGGDRLLVHVDAYRLTAPEQWDGLMIEDFLRSPWTLVVEWPEHVASRVPPDAIWLRFELRADGARVIRRVSKGTGSGAPGAGADHEA